MSSAPGDMEVQLSVVADFRNAASAGSLLGMGAGTDGTVVAVLGDRSGPTLRSRGARAGAAVFVRDGQPIRRLELEPIELRSVRPQPLLDGGVVVVEAQGRGDGPNATVFGPDGKVRCQFAAGNGVEEAMLDANGELWVGYFDEGVSGVERSEGEGSAASLSRTGLNRFDLTGELTWSYSSSRVGPIYHCYALNIGADSAWAVIYNEAFELIRVRPGAEIDAWGGLGTAGWARGLLVEGDEVLVVGAQHGPASAALWHLGDTPELVRTFRIQAPRGFPAPEHAETYGRGGTLYLPEDGVCYALTLRR